MFSFHSIAREVDAPPQAISAFYRFVGLRSIALDGRGIEEWQTRKIREFGELLGGCQSPIEKMMAAALLGMWPGPVEVSTPSMAGDDDVAIAPQVSIGSARVDFLITAKKKDGSEMKVVVECDGHEFHEKTKEQAQRDKGRDRALVAEGCVVLRFTGSEIFRSPWECANEVDAVVETLIFGLE